jgi:dTDP-4-dehydrorhamnose 3,5-epimerase
MPEVVKDPPSVDAHGEPLAQLPEGVTFRDSPVHVDDRGFVTELFDPRWDWHPAPFAFAYAFTIRPGKIKGWGLHKRHEDRYFVLFGEMQVVFYDDRESSPTRGLVSSVVLSEHRRRLMNIPAGIWHANRNIGDKDTIVVNFPTIPYDHADPDKYRLPLDTEEIPYTWPDPKGW